MSDPRKIVDRILAGLEQVLITLIGCAIVAMCVLSFLAIAGYGP